MLLPKLMNGVLGASGGGEYVIGGGEAFNFIACFVDGVTVGGEKGRDSRLGR